MVEERAGVYCKNCSHYNYDSGRKAEFTHWCLRYQHDINEWDRGCSYFDLINELWDEAYEELKREGKFDKLYPPFTNY